VQGDKGASLYAESNRRWGERDEVTVPRPRAVSLLARLAHASMTSEVGPQWGIVDPRHCT